MNPLSPHTGSTRKELALAIGLLITGISCFPLAEESAKADAGVVSSRNKACDIHIMLTPWARDNDQSFPPADKYSNEAFRVL